jgi:pilus assembly protein Flp/PilA
MFHVLLTPLVVLHGRFVGWKFPAAQAILATGEVMSFQLQCSAGNTFVRRQLAAAATIGKRLLREDSGQDLIEYTLVAALIGLSAVVAMRGLGNKIGNSFNTVGSNLTNDL